MFWKLIPGRDSWEIWQGDEKQEERALPFLRGCASQHFSSLTELEEWLKKEESRRAKNRAIRLLAMRNYPTTLLTRKLLFDGYCREIVQQIVQWAEKMGYVQDDEYLRSSILQELRRGYGPKVILWKLRTKGFSEEVLLRAIAQHSTMALQKEGIRKLMKRRPGDRRKAVAMLLRRGYPLELIKTQLSLEIEETE